MIKSGFEFHSFLNLVRVLFPKWSFFDESGHLFYLEVKPVGSDTWSNLKEDQERSALGLFFNPKMNLSHALNTLILQFVQDLQSLLEVERAPTEQDLETLSSFKMVRSLALLEVENSDFRSGGFQFRVTAHKGNSVETVFVSNVLNMRRP